MHYPEIMQPTHARWEVVEDHDDLPNGAYSNGTVAETEQEEQKASIFPKLNSFYPRNFMIHDLHLETAPNTFANFDKPDAYEVPKGLVSVSDDIIDDLPEECRVAFEEARAAECDYQSRWGREAEDGQRAKFLPTTVWFP